MKNAGVGKRTVSCAELSKREMHTLGGRQVYEWLFPSSITFCLISAPSPQQPAEQGRRKGQCLKPQ